MKMIRIGTHILTTAVLSVSAGPAAITQYFQNATPVSPNPQAFLADLICGNLDNPLTVCEDSAQENPASSQVNGQVSGPTKNQSNSPVGSPASTPARTPARTEKNTPSSSAPDVTTSLSSNQLPTQDESSQSFVPLEPRVSANFASYENIAGGPVLRVPDGLPGAGNYLMVYEAGRKASATRFYSILGLAKSYDNGVTWQDLGEIIQSRGTNHTSAASFDVKYGGVIIDQSKKFLVIQYQDLSDNKRNSAWRSEARIPLVSLLQSAFRSAAATQIVYVSAKNKDRAQSPNF